MPQRLENLYQAVIAEIGGVQCNLVAFPAICIGPTQGGEVAHGVSLALNRDHARRQLTSKQARIEVIVGCLEQAVELTCRAFVAKLHVETL